jgi:hypothetical protein
MFERVLVDGNWNNAEAIAQAEKELQGQEKVKPWVVLVTGVNGIRKTTSIHQPWFKDILAQALAGQGAGPTQELPDGANSFFRQLDFIIATVANAEFATLYRDHTHDVDVYSSTKASIFTRYRTVAEITGALLVKTATSKGMNLMAETSGRDIAMFKYGVCCLRSLHFIF